MPSSEGGKRGTRGRPGDPESGGLRADGEASYRREAGDWGGQRPLLPPGKETCLTRRAQSSDRTNQARPGNQDVHDAVGDHASFSQKLTYHSGKREQNKDVEKVTNSTNRRALRPPRTQGQLTKMTLLGPKERSARLKKSIP